MDVKSRGRSNRWTYYCMEIWTVGRKDSWTYSTQGLTYRGMGIGLDGPTNNRLTDGWTYS